MQGQLAFDFGDQGDGTEAFDAVASSSIVNRLYVAGVLSDEDIRELMAMDVCARLELLLRFEFAGTSRRRLTNR